MSRGLVGLLSLYGIRAKDILLDDPCHFEPASSSPPVAGTTQTSIRNSSYF